MTSLTKRHLTAIAGGSLVLLLGLGLWFFALSPQLSKESEIRDEIGTTETRNQTMEVQAIRLEEQKRNLPTQREYADALASRFPATADQAGMFSQIREAAAKAGIPDRKVTAVTPSAPTSATTAGQDGSKTLPSAAGGVKGAASFEIGITASASLPRLVKFLDALEGMDRSYMVTSVAFGPGGTTDYTLTLGGKMFALPAPVDPDEAAATPATTPPATAPVSPAPSPSGQATPAAP